MRTPPGNNRVRVREKLLPSRWFSGQFDESVTAEGWADPRVQRSIVNTTVGGAIGRNTVFDTAGEEQQRNDREGESQSGPSNVVHKLRGKLTRTVCKHGP